MKTTLKMLLGIMSLLFFFSCEGVSSLPDGNSTNQPDGGGTGDPGTIVTDEFETDFTLLSGQTGKGYLSIDETETWTFEAEAGDHISASVGETVSTPMSFNIKLIAPDGVLLDSSYNQAAGASVSDVATVSGTYTLEIYESSRNDEGNYRINLVVSGGGLSISTGDQGGAIVSGATEEGNFTFGDIDGWTFFATAGDHISASVGETVASDMSHNIKLIAPDGVLLDSSYNQSSGASVSDSATVTGTYTVVVYDSSHNNEGDYRIHLVVSGGGLSISTGDQGGAIVSGATEEGNFTFGDIDGWTFHADAGDHISASVGETVASDMSHNIKLIAPDGVLLDSSYNQSSGASVSDRATVTGTYTVVVYDSTHNNEGDYRINLVVSGGGLFISAGDQGGAIVSGATEEGNFTYGDIDGWTFFATAGDYISASLGETVASDMSHNIKLIAPDGTLLDSSYNQSSGASVSDRATVTGTYTVVVYESSHNNEGDYRINLVVSGGGLSISIGDQGGAIAFGTSETGSYTFGDIDGWTFYATAGDSISASVGETVASDMSHNIKLIAPDGTLLDSSYNQSSSATVSRTASASGIYTIVVYESLHDDEGVYRLTLSH